MKLPVADEKLSVAVQAFDLLQRFHVFCELADGQVAQDLFCPNDIAELTDVNQRQKLQEQPSTHNGSRVHEQTFNVELFIEVEKLFFTASLALYNTSNAVNRALIAFDRIQKNLV